MTSEWTQGLSRRQAMLGLAAGACTGLAWAQDSTEAALEARAPAMPALGTRLQVPDITLLDGSTFRAQAGQPLLIYWWASTCPFCALQSPAMQALWQAQQSRGLKMVALSIDKTPDEARAYLHKRGYTFPAAWASAAWRRSFPKPKGLPITLLLNRQQTLVLAEKGQMFAEDVEAIGQLI
jgi:peroxiredoxin